MADTRKFQAVLPDSSVVVRSSALALSHVVVRSDNRAEAIARAEALVHASRMESEATRRAVAARLAALKASDHPACFKVLSWHESEAAAAKVASARCARVVPVVVAS